MVWSRRGGRRVRLLTAEFADLAVEQDFRRWQGPASAREAVAGFIIVAVFNSLFIVADYFSMGLSPTFRWMVVGRTFVVLMCALLSVRLRRDPSFAMAERLVTTFLLAYVALYFPYIPYDPAVAQVAKLSFICITLLSYVLFPSHCGRLLSLGIFNGLGFLMVLGLWVDPPSGPFELAELSLWLLLANFAGAGLAYRHGRMARAHFSLILDERRSAEDAQKARNRAEEAAQAKSDFLAMMSHEIRTPLAGLMGCARLLLDTRLDEVQRDYAETMHQSGDALLSVLNDILDFTKIEAGRLELEQSCFAVGPLMDGVVALLAARAQEKGLALLVRRPAGPQLQLSGDPARLRQILLNLLGNAVKFTDAGEVTIVASIHPLEPGLVWLSIAVSDTGIGIPRDIQPLLFRPFSQADNSISRRFGGTGLGLAISRRLALLMGGDITVQSRLGEGSCFTIGVPVSLAEDQSQVLAPCEPAPAPLQPRLKLLLAEDNPVNQKVAAAILRKFGHEVTVVGDGYEALEAARSKDWDAILMDVQMPGLDGLEATRRIRALEGPRSRVQVIALTANALKGDADKCIEAGMDGYLAKPIEPKKLQAALNQHCQPDDNARRLIDNAFAPVSA